MHGSLAARAARERTLTLTLTWYPHAPNHTTLPVGMPVDLSVRMFYPAVMPLGNMPEGCGVPPSKQLVKATAVGGATAAMAAAAVTTETTETAKPVVCADVVLPPHKWPSAESVDDAGLCLFYNGREIFLYVGEFVETATTEALFGLASTTGANCSKADLCLVPRDSDLSRRVLAIVGTIRKLRVGGVLPTVRVVLHDSALVPTLKGMLVEDRSFQDMSYVEYLCHIHKEIQVRLQEQDY